MSDHLPGDSVVQELTGTPEEGSGSPPGDAAELVGATPTLSAAETLAATPFFGDLSAVDLARLVPELEEYQCGPGEAVFCQGDPSDGLYLIRSGTVRVAVTEESGTQTVSILRAPAHFGETGLLLDEPRAAGATALTPLAVWKLPRERFQALVDEHPRLGLRLAAALAERVSVLTRQLGDSREQMVSAARAAYGSLDHAAQALLRRIAVFITFDAELLRSALESEWSDAPFERLVEEAVFFQTADREGWHSFVQDSIRAFLLRELRAEVGERGIQTLRSRAARELRARPEAKPADVLDLLHAAGDWPRLARMLEEAGDALIEARAERIEGYVRALPPRLLWRRPALVRLMADACSAQGKLEHAVETYREAEKHDPAARAGDVAVEYQRALAELCQQLGNEEESVACLRRAIELEGRQSGRSSGDNAGGARSLADPLDDAANDGEETARGVRLGRGRGLSVGTLLGGMSSGVLSARWLATIGALVLTALAWQLLPPPPGLSPEALRVLITIAALVTLSFLDVLPDYLLGLLMIGAWVVTGTLPPAVAAAGFASSTWFLLLASMAIGTAVARSGLLYRGAIELVRRLPASHAIRCLTLAGLGVLFTPGMPSVPGRIMLAGPLSRDIADALRYPDRSGGSAGLALATFIGFGAMGALFLTGTPLSLIAYGLFPPEVQARMNWVNWFLAALPTHLVLFGLTLGFILFRYRSEGPDELPEGTLALQRRVLGRLSRDEWSALVILVLLLVGFSTQS